MPTLRKDKGNNWMARVLVNGRQVACKMFPPGKKHGPEWRAAKQWEEEQRVLTAVQAVERTPTGLEKLLAWGDAYLAHAERTMKRQTKVGKATVMRAFFTFCREQEIEGLEGVTRPKVYAFLSKVMDERGPSRANLYRKNLLAAWNWGIDFVEGFPQGTSVIEKIKAFHVEEEDRYVPPEEDVIKVLKLAQGQDLVMLLAYYFLGGRRSEIFHLSWEKDVRLDDRRIRLIDYKGKNGAKRIRWYDMHPELVKAFSWWLAARPCNVDNVFMQTHCTTHMGKPFKQRRHLMPRLCAKAEVKPFGFHAMRHKSAAITFEAEGLSAARILMGHYRATTTDIYVRSAGLYSDQGGIMDALGKSKIGQAVGSLLEKSFPHEGQVHGENCNPEHVTQ